VEDRGPLFFQHVKGLQKSGQIYKADVAGKRWKHKRGYVCCRELMHKKSAFLITTLAADDHHVSIRWRMRGKVIYVTLCAAKIRLRDQIQYFVWLWRSSWYDSFHYLRLRFWLCFGLCFWSTVRG